LWVVKKEKLNGKESKDKGKVEEMKMEKVVQILEVTRQPVLKCHITGKCNLSSFTFTNYISLLLQSGLLNAYPAIDLRLVGRPTRRRMIYQTSIKGKEFLKRYNDLLTLLEISVINPRSLNLHGALKIQSKWRG
jgi:predicted transcriptional regulator